MTSTPTDLTADQVNLVLENDPQLIALRAKIVTALTEAADHPAPNSFAFGLFINRVLDEDELGVFFKLDALHGEAAISRWWVTTLVETGLYGEVELIDYTTLTASQIGGRLAAITDKILTVLATTPDSVLIDPEVTPSARLGDFLAACMTPGDRAFMASLEDLRGLPFCLTWTRTILIQSNRFTDQFIDLLTSRFDPNGELDNDELDAAIDLLDAKNLILKPR